MKRDDAQLGRPFKHFRGTKAEIEALTGLVGGEEAHATDSGDNGVYDEILSRWVWFKQPFVEYIDLDTAGTGTPGTPGRMSWNSDERTVDVGMEDGIILQLGHELLFDVKNQTGATITDGTPAMFAGTLGASGRTLIQKAIADGSLDSEYILGIVTHDISNGEDGKVTWFGKVRGINTTGSPYGETWADGDLLYVSQTTAGYLTNVEPASGQKILVAAVIYAHSTQGTLLVRPTWDTNGGGGTPGGDDTEIQVNDAGAFAGFPTFRRQSNGAIIIGDIDEDITIEPYSLGQGADDSSIANFLESFGASVASYIALLRARGTHDAPEAVQSGDVIGRIRGHAHDGTAWSNTKMEIRLVANENWSSGNHGARIEIYTTPDGSDTLTLVATFTDDGHIDISSGKEYRVNGVQHTHATESFAIKNTSGATANTGDVGYINEAGEYKTTTTAQDSVKWCVVITGGADNADIYVARRGRVTVNYTGTAPSAGHYLSTSTSAGLAQRETAMHPAIFAVCTAAGSGGTVEVQLLCLTVFRPLVKSTDILRINSLSRTDFVATINGTPGATYLVYNAPSSGNENTIVPASSSEVGNLVCFNTTRGTSALVDSVNTGTNTITFVTAPPAGSANGDTITFRSQTYPSALQTGIYLYEIDLTGCNLTLARSVALSCQAHDTGTIGGNVFAFIHKLSASPGFASGISWIADWSHIIVPAVELVDNKIMFAVGASGTGTMNYFIVRLNGVWEAVP